MRILIALLLVGVPGLAHAQGTIQTFLVGIYDLINFYVVPLLVTIAVLFFVYNTVQYFIIKSHDQDGREKARRFMLWSVIAFVIIVALWGIVNFLIGGLGFRAGTSAVCPDYLPSSACREDGSSPVPIPRPRPEGSGQQTTPPPASGESSTQTESEFELLLNGSFVTSQQREQLLEEYEQSPPQVQEFMRRNFTCPGGGEPSITRWNGAGDYETTCESQ